MLGRLLWSAGGERASVCDGYETLSVRLFFTHSFPFFDTFGTVIE